MSCGARIRIPTSPVGRAAPLSGSVMRISTSGRGMPTEPILLGPSTGLTAQASMASVSE